MQGKEVIPQEEYTEKLGAAIDARENKDFIIVARTDSRATEGLENQLKEEFKIKKQVLIYSLKLQESLDEMKKIGKEIKAPLVANMIEGGATPMNSAQTLNKIGFNIILYPLSVLFANTFATMNILQELKNSGTTSKYKQKVVNFDQFNNLVELDKFKKMETKYKFTKRK